MDLLCMLVVAGAEEVDHWVELVDFGLLQRSHGGALDHVGPAILKLDLCDSLCVLD